MDPLSRNEISEAAEAAIRRHVATTDRPLEELRVLATQLSDAIAAAIRNASGDQATHESVRDILLGAILRIWKEHGGNAKDLAQAIQLRRPRTLIRRAAPARRSPLAARRPEHERARRPHPDDPRHGEEDEFHRPMQAADMVGGQQHDDDIGEEACQADQDRKG